MPDIAIKITNLPEIKAAFRKSPTLMVKELDVAIRSVLFIIGGSSRTRTPVDTGRLRASTYEKFSRLKGEVGTNTKYDVHVHEGTRFMRARPYLRMAVEANGGAINDEFTAAVDRVLNQIGRST